MACEALADCSVTLGGRRKSERTIRREKRTATDVVQGATRVTSLDNEIAGLEL